MSFQRSSPSGPVEDPVSRESKPWALAGKFERKRSGEAMNRAKSRVLPSVWLRVQDWARIDPIQAFSLGCPSSLLQKIETSAVTDHRQQTRDFTLEFWALYNSRTLYRGHLIIENRFSSSPPVHPLAIRSSTPGHGSWARWIPCPILAASQSGPTRR